MEPPTTNNPSRQVGIDVRSRDAFELLKLGEAIVNLQRDLQILRLEKEDLRFERNRYQASAAQYQSKLVRTLDELDQARVYRDEAERTRREVVILAREFADRLEQERSAFGEYKRQVQTLQHEIAELKSGYDGHLKHELMRSRAELKAEYDDRLRREVVSLCRECATKFADQADRLEHERSKAAEYNRQLQTLQDEIAGLKSGHDEHVQREIMRVRTELKAEYDNRLRREVVSLSRECATKLADQADAMSQESVSKPAPGFIKRWKLK